MEFERSFGVWICFSPLIIALLLIIALFLQRYKIMAIFPLAKLTFLEIDFMVAHKKDAPIKPSGEG
jgi:hypothetical protein